MFLERIVTQTRIDLEQHKREQPLEELQRRVSEQTPARDLRQALSSRPQVNLIAEVKRASPSKGMLAPHIDPVELACTYEQNGAAAISVLTEPHFFLGSSEFLTAIKAAVNVPVLRKDFIVDEYQVYEARAWGADAILLICAILDDAQLSHLLQVARTLGMHCLVEAHSKEEAQRAISAGAMIIGVNSRDLVSFKMNPYLIRDLRSLIPADRVVVAESGIHTAADARRLARYDVQAMLVGESLVVSNDVPGQMRMLLQGANKSTQAKICGLRTPEHIDTCIEAGADLLGFIFHEPSHRYIEPRQVKAALKDSKLYNNGASEHALPDLVGVFVNKEAAYINEVAEELGLHYIQLHGTESPAFCQQIKRPVIKAIQAGSQIDLDLLLSYRDAAWRILLDTPTSEWGGTGVTHDWNIARTAAQTAQILLAGGLNPENVREAVLHVKPWGVDVSSGVETNKQKDSQKIRAFMQAVRNTDTIQE
ncbi:bifunctional indole-3-glycerol-phosphate synthase TrpC/phosphoribosylanthranilate isomerase TrpF [Ktedonosporobacter rubrisoli]|uniref:Multifunctional fusion protein n=1 Tax=Ktedonosporobacter rubrisoli TaxID=2509675 RepID=A0A4P6JRG1_KTERU|nr:bifunctional indole-3-glycerol-phosphate synthase TrpC/phosphoribosylanthranilate isomerase TrpF [Ktedonosporobacter rubrisoli]QBD77790.1 bifunctional indole-3-glycerol-phosphate synthase TrpC/phosphoribosylanthranilate isomerase TrpF [Ktedonosporobacter rubrisoli]